MNFKATLAGFALLVSATSAQAVVVWAEASAGGVRVDINVTTPGPAVDNVTIGPLPGVNGIAPPAFNLTDNVAAVDTGPVGGGLNASSGVGTVNASSNTDGGFGSRQAAADALVNNFSFDNGLIAAIGLTADSVASNAVVMGDVNSLLASANTTLANAVLNVAGTPTNLANNPAPNTVVLDAGGIRITLNEQTLMGDGLASQVINVTAIRIELDNFVLGVASLSGDIFVAESSALLMAIPAPASAALLLPGLLIWRRRRVGI